MVLLLIMSVFAKFPSYFLSYHKNYCRKIVSIKYINFIFSTMKIVHRGHLEIFVFMLLAPEICLKMFCVFVFSVSGWKFASGSEC